MKKILLIEDDQIVANVYRNKLSVEGYQTEAALDGESGLELMHSFQPDAIVLDLMLPKMSGVEVIREIRREAEFSKLPIIVFSNTYLTNLVQEAWKAGATKCISKINCSPKEFLELVRHTVGGVRSVDTAILRSARSMGVRGPAWLFGVLLPAAAHAIFTGVRAGGGLLFFMLIGAEMIGAGAGLGWFLHNAAANYQITRIYAAGLLILVCGALLDGALAAFERRVPFRIGPRGMGAAGLLLTVIVIVTAPAIQAMDRANAQVMTDHPSCHETHNQPEPTPDDLERLSKEFTGGH